MFEIHPTLREKDIQKTLTTIDKVLCKASSLKTKK